MRRAVAGSWIIATRRRGPPQRAQTRTSRPKVGPAEQFAPGQGAALASTGLSGAGAVASVVVGRLGEGDDLAAPGGGRCQDAVVAQEVDAGPRDQGDQAGDEVDGGEEEGPGAVPQDSWQPQRDAAVGAEGESVVGERGAEQVAAEALEIGP